MLKYTLLAASLLATTAPLAKADHRGFFAGAGLTNFSQSDCDACDHDGFVLEGGYDINRIVGVELKYISTEGEIGGYETDQDQYSVVANVGHDFNTGWFRLYGKAGMMKIDTSARELGVDASDTGSTLGAGVRFMLTGKTDGPYAKLELMSVLYEDDEAGVNLIGAMGWRF